MKTKTLLAAFIAAALLASCSGDDDNPWYGDFGNIQVPDTRLLEQQVDADAETASGIAFTAQAPWSSSIEETRSAAPAWISVSPDHGDAGSYTLRFELRPNDLGQSRTAVITIVCGDSRITATVTQLAPGGSDQPDGPTEQSGRIARIAWYDAQETELTGEFVYDAKGRLASYVERRRQSSDQNPWFVTRHELFYDDADAVTYRYSSDKDKEYPARVRLNEAGYWSEYDGSYEEETHRVSAIRRFTYSDGRIRQEKGSSLATPDPDHKNDTWEYAYTWTEGNLTRTDSRYVSPYPDIEDNENSLSLEYDQRDNPFADEAVDPVQINPRYDDFNELSLGFMGPHSRKLLRKVWDATAIRWEASFNYTFDNKGRISRVDMEYRRFSEADGTPMETTRYYALFTYEE